MKKRNFLKKCKKSMFSSSKRKSKKQRFLFSLGFVFTAMLLILLRVNQISEIQAKGTIESSETTNSSITESSGLADDSSMIQEFLVLPEPSVTDDSSSSSEKSDSLTKIQGVAGDSLVSPLGGPIFPMPNVTWKAVSSWAELQAAAGDTSTEGVYFTKDINVTGTATISNKNFAIDGRDFALNYTGSVSSNTFTLSATGTARTLTLTNLTINQPNNTQTYYTFSTTQGAYWSVDINNFKTSSGHKMGLINGGITTQATTTGMTVNLYGQNAIDYSPTTVSNTTAASVFNLVQNLNLYGELDYSSTSIYAKLFYSMRTALGSASSFNIKPDSVLNANGNSNDLIVFNGSGNTTIEKATVKGKLTTGRFVYYQTNMLSNSSSGDIINSQLNIVDSTFEFETAGNEIISFDRTGASSGNGSSLNLEMTDSNVSLLSTYTGSGIASNDNMLGIIKMNADSGKGQYTFSVNHSELSIQSPVENTTTTRGGIYPININGTGIATITDNSKVDIVTNGSPTTATNGDVNGAAVKIAVDSSSTNGTRLDIENNSIFNVKTKSSVSTIESLPAIRLSGSKNEINVTSAGQLSIKNEGNGVIADPATVIALPKSSNVGIIMQTANSTDVSGTSIFNLTGANSSVEIIADYGAALWGAGHKTTVNADEGTYFTARGKTEVGYQGNAGGNQVTNNVGIFSSETLDLNFNKMSYFDFANTREGGGPLLYSVLSGLTTIDFSNSVLSLWVVGKQDINAAPADSWVDVAMTATVHFPYATVTSPGTITQNILSSNSDSLTQFLSVPGQSWGHITRMTGNNQTAYIDELRVPSNADQYIWGHASIPENITDPPRGAYAGEVMVTANVYDASDNLLYSNLQGTVVEDDASGKTSVYGDAARSGIFKIPLPNGNYMPKGGRVEIVSAYRNTIISPAGIEADAKTKSVVDVIPPEPIEYNGAISSQATALSGNGAEPNTRLYIYQDTGNYDVGTLIGSTIVTPAGSWSISFTAGTLVAGKEVSIYLAKGETVTPAPYDSVTGLYDQTGNGLIEPPRTNNSVADRGNINPYIQGAANGTTANNWQYHDMTFKGVNKYIVEDVPVDPGKLEFVTDGGQNNLVIDFRLHDPKYSSIIRVNDPDIQGKLEVSDTRIDASAGWTLKVQATSLLSNGAISLPEAIRYKRAGSNEFVIGTDKQILVSNNSGTAGIYNISGTWGNTKDSEGFKFETESVKVAELGQYNANLLFTLEETYQP